MKYSHASCDQHDHSANKPKVRSLAELEKAAGLFKALGDPARLRVLCLLIDGPRCVSEIVELLGEKFSTVSQRLRLLRSEGLVKRRRDGLHIHYELSDRHVVDLIHNGMAHADELRGSPTPAPNEDD